MPEERSVSSTGGEKGVKEARFDLIPARPLWLLAEHYGKGAKKYAVHQWRAGYEWSKNIAALERHFNLFKQGIDYDVCSNEPDNCMHEFKGEAWDGPEDTCWNHTGSHHMQAVMWMAFGLMEFVEQFPEFDDRFLYPKNIEGVTPCDILSGYGGEEFVYYCNTHRYMFAEGQCHYKGT